MKYLTIILAIIITASLATALLLRPQQPEATGDIAVTINGHGLDRDTISNANGPRGHHNGGDEELLESAITRELLLQEAQRQQIDKEESFRQALKTFYEQSLINILLDRQYTTFEVTVSDEEIDHYLSLYGAMITFSRIPADNTTSSESPRQSEVLFDDLSGPLQFLIASLEVGEQASRFDTGNEEYRIQLDKVVPAPQEVDGRTDRETIRHLLLEQKRQQELNNWLKILRNKASITIHSN